MELSEDERMRAVYEAVRRWWADGIRPRIPYRTWSSQQAGRLVQELGEIMDGSEDG